MQDDFAAVCRAGCRSSVRVLPRRWGFRILGYFVDPPVLAIAARDSVEIQFGRADGERPPSPNWTRRQGGLDADIWVNDLDSLHAELKARGAKIIEAPELTVYKCY
jgi:hypothetical protein